MGNHIRAISMCAKVGDLDTTLNGQNAYAVKSNLLRAQRPAPDSATDLLVFIYDKNNVEISCRGGTGGLAEKRWTCDHLDCGFESRRGHLRDNLWQVVHTYVPLSPNSELGTGRRTVNFFGWEADRRPGSK